MLRWMVPEDDEDSPHMCCLKRFEEGTSIDLALCPKTQAAACMIV